MLYFILEYGFFIYILYYNIIYYNMVRKSKKSKKNKKRGGMRDISVSPSRKRKNPYAEGQGHSMDIATNIKDLATGTIKLSSGSATATPILIF